MKRLAVFLLAAFMLSGAYAQNSNVVAAFNYLKRGKLDKAKEAIDLATANDKSKDDPKTWFYCGNVYLSIQLTEEDEYKSLDPQALDKAFEAYTKSLELDEKNTYSAEVKDRIQVCAEQYFNRGVTAYNEQAYKKASDAFAKSAEVNNSLGNADSASIFYAAQSAYFGENFNEAKKYFEDLIVMQYKDPGIYRMLADIQRRDGDTTLAITTINEGRKIYPDDYNLIVDAANVYLSTGQNKEALDVLTLAMEKDKTNATLYFAAGTIYDKMGNFDDAANMYLKSIEVDPEYFDANYNLGALYYNKAAEKITEAGNLPLNESKKYEEYLAEGKEMMKKALPYLEKADTIQPSDAITLQTLKEIYTRLNMMEKLKGINERLNN